MEAGIVGLPNVGKSTLFNALTSAGIASENYPFCTIEPNTGIVPVPDSRLKTIESFIQTQKVVPAFLKLVDIAGIVRGASKGEGLGNKFLSHIREVDAIVHVVRCFEDPDVTHVEGGVEPLRDIETIEIELMLADMQSLDSAYEKAIKRTRSGGDKEAKQRVALIEQCQQHLENDQPIRSLEIVDPELKKMLASFQLLTAKPVLYVANVEEHDLAGTGELVEKVRNKAKAEGSEVVTVCARLEAELAELDPEDRREMLESVGLAEPALNVLARAAYRVLGLQSYFTAGEKEIRAWTIPIGTTAPQAAGVIHTDFERGFIRVEVFSLHDLEEYHSEKAIREAGKLRVEGKEYVVQDGDICHFLFNV